MKLPHYPPLSFAWAIVVFVALLYTASVMGFLVGYGDPYRTPALMASVGLFMVACLQDRPTIRDRWRELRAWRKTRRNACDSSKRG